MLTCQRMFLTVGDFGAKSCLVAWRGSIAIPVQFTSAPKKKKKTLEGIQRIVQNFINQGLNSQSSSFLARVFIRGGTGRNETVRRLTAIFTNRTFATTIGWHVFLRSVIARMKSFVNTVPDFVFAHVWALRRVEAKTTHDRLFPPPCLFVSLI